MRLVENINTHWQFIARDDASAQFTNFYGQYELICLPHNNSVLPHNNFTESDFCLSVGTDGV